MNSDLIIIIVICSLFGTSSIYSCFICYRSFIICYANIIKKKQDNNRISFVLNILKRKNIIRPITDEEEMKDEKLNDIKTVEIRTAEYFV